MAELKRSLKAHSVASAGAGFAFATLSIVASVQVAALMPGNTGWLAVLAAAVVSVVASLAFAELSAMYPTSAGVRLYIQKAFGTKLATPLASAYILIVVAASGAEAFVFGSTLEALLPGGPPVWFWMVAAFLVVGLVNFRGIELSSGLQNVLTYLMFAFLVSASVAALVRFGVRYDNWYNPFGEGSSGLAVVSGVAVAIFLFAGFEWVTALSEETEDPKVIGWGMLGAIGILCTVYALLNVALVSAVPKDVLAGKQPWVDGLYYGARPHVVFVRVVFGEYDRLGLVGVAVLTFMASMTSFNAGILTTSRFLYAMSRDKAAPKAFSKIHLSYFTPYVSVMALVGFAIGMSLLLATLGGFDAFTFAVAGSEALMYLAVALCLLKLRKTHPDQARPFRVPGLPWSAWGMVGLFGALLVMVFGSAERAALVGLAIFLGVLALMVGYTVWVVPRLQRKKPKT